MNDLCCIAFRGEAYESAADALRHMRGWTVEVVLGEDASFTATVLDLETDDAGEYAIRLGVWRADDDAYLDGDETRVLNIHTGFERLEVY